MVTQDTIPSLCSERHGEYLVWPRENWRSGASDQKEKKIGITRPHLDGRVIMIIQYFAVKNKGKEAGANKTTAKPGLKGTGSRSFNPPVPLPPTNYGATQK